MRVLILTLLSTLVYITGFAQTIEMYALDGDGITFSIETNQAVRWHFQKKGDTEWKLLSDRNAFVFKETNEGKLFATVLYNDLTLQFTDTIVFGPNHTNASSGVFINNKFYPTVNINGLVIMAEDLEGEYTYEEALALANSIEGWMLPIYFSIDPTRNNGEGYTFYDQAHMILYNYARENYISTGNSQLLKGGLSGFNAVPNSPIKNKEIAYWMNAGKLSTDFRALGIFENGAGMLSPLDYNYKLKIRLVKEHEAFNAPPEQVTQLWPFNGLRQVTRTPNFVWEPVSDPDGDSVYYELSYSSNRGLSKKIITKNTSYQVVEPIDYITAINWKVTAFDSKGNYYYTGTFEFFTHRESETATEDPGTYGVQPLEIYNPTDGEEIMHEGVSIRYERFTDLSMYEVYGGLQNPPIIVDATTQTTSKLNSLLRDTTYYIQVKAVDKATRKLLAQSQVISIKTGQKEVIIENTKEEGAKTAGKDAVETEDDIYDLTPEMGTSTCVSKSTYVQFTFKTTINTEGEFRMYMKPKSNIKGVESGWEVLQMIKPLGIGGGVSYGGIALYPLNINQSFTTDELEWKIAFYDKAQNKETYVSKSQTLFLKERVSLPTTTVTIDGNNAKWLNVDGAEGYKVVFKETYRDCYQCRTAYGCDFERFFSYTTTDTEFELPACSDYSMKYQLAIQPFSEGGCSESPVEWTFVNSCKPKTCPEYLWKKVVEKEDPKGSGGVKDGGSGGSNDLKSNWPIAIVWQKKPGGLYYAYGTLQKTSGSKDREDALNASVHTCQKNQWKFFKNCGNFEIYLLPNCDMGLTEEDGKTAIQKVHSYLLNNGCNPY